MWAKTALVLCFGFIWAMVCARGDNPKLPSGIWQDLDKVHIAKFVANGESRSVVVAKLNEALHKAAPTSQIKISFVPPNLPEIDEAKYAREIHIDVHGCTVVDLLWIMAMYDIQWEVRGKNLVGIQSHSD